MKNGKTIINSAEGRVIRLSVYSTGHEEHPKTGGRSTGKKLIVNLKSKYMPSILLPQRSPFKLFKLPALKTKKFWLPEKSSTFLLNNFSSTEDLSEND